jgi:hypothetical protein
VVALALRRLREEDLKFNASLGCTAKLWFKKRKK